MQNSSENIATVLSLVGFHLVLHDFISCGKSEIVVNVAATKPTIVMMFMCVLSRCHNWAAWVYFRFSLQSLKSVDV